VCCKRVLVTAALVASTAIALAQSLAPTLESLIEGSTVVAGKAAQGAAPIEIYDVSFEVKTRIGLVAALNDSGAFATPVRPPLVKGHTIVAIDRNGNVSLPVIVGPLP